MDPEFVKILACPACKSAVEKVEDEIVCQSPACGLHYPIRDGIPIMLIEEARQGKTRNR